MTSSSQAEPTGRASPQHGGRRRPATRWIVHGVLLVALAVGVFGVLPRLGGLTRDAADLRHGRPAFMVAAVLAQAVSLGCYAQLYRHVLGALGAKIRFRLAADVTLASFLVSHLTPLGSATGTLVNVNTLETEGVAAATTSEAIALTSLESTTALIALFGSGFAATAGRNLPQAYLTIVGLALVLVTAVLAAVLLVGAHPAVAARAGRWAATVARRFRPGIDPAQAAATASRLAELARSALTGRAFWIGFGLAAGDLLTDLLSLDLMFLAFGYQPGFGPLAVAYAAANIASAIPITPGGLGVIEVTLVAITVGFGSPRAIAVLAVLGYRVVNYWLPLIPGAIAYARIRLRSPKTKKLAKRSGVNASRKASARPRHSARQYHHSPCRFYRRAITRQHGNERCRIKEGTP
jgi:uncharacterized protein (TIRG00374 family)